MSDLGSGYLQCPGCGVHYVDTGCGQIAEHAGCPYACSICGKLIVYFPDTVDTCPGHTMTEHMDHVNKLRKRTRGTPGQESSGS